MYGLLSSSSLITDNLSQNLAVLVQYIFISPHYATLIMHIYVHFVRIHHVCMCIIPYLPMCVFACTYKI